MQAGSARVLKALMFAGLATALVPTANAQHGNADCPADAPALPAALAGWTPSTPMTAARRAGGLDAATLTIGKAVDATLSPTPDVRYVLRPEKPGGSVSHGGLFAFDVDTPGTYRVALASGAWIDVLRQDEAVESSAHGHGPACSGIRKMVDFPLEPGRYILQIAANGDPGLKLLVTRLP